MSDVEVAVHAAALAAGVAASHLRESLEIEYKGAYSDPVTDADREAEQAVRDFLAQERPADGVIGEELVDKPGKRQWLVDPIDGTVNYLRGNAYWARLWLSLMPDAPWPLRCTRQTDQQASPQSTTAVRGGTATHLI